MDTDGRWVPPTVHFFMPRRGDGKWDTERLVYVCVCVEPQLICMCMYGTKAQTTPGQTRAENGGAHEIACRHKASLHIQERLASRAFTNDSRHKTMRHCGDERCAACVCMYA